MQEMRKRKTFVTARWVYPNTKFIAKPLERLTQDTADLDKSTETPRQIQICVSLAIPTYIMVTGVIDGTYT